jgi:hypothetical protein
MLWFATLRTRYCGLPPCFSCNHSPAPKIFSPLESITTFTGPLGFFNFVVNDRRALRRDKVVWSGIGRSRPSIWMIERSIPSVCRQGLPGAASLRSQ